MALVPWAGVKLVLLAALAAEAGRRFADGFRLSRAAAQRGRLLAVWAALIVSPLWLIPRSTPSRLLALLLTAAAVFLWSRLGDAVRVRPAAAAARWSAGLVCLALLAWHGPGTFAPLEFRGDEDFHVVRPLRALEALTTAGAPYGTLLSVVFTIGLVCFAASARVRSAAYWAFVGIVPLLWFAPLLGRPLEAELLRLARYPLLGAWLHLATAFSPLQASPDFRASLYQEALYRLVPFASMLTLALFVWRVVKGPAWFRGAAAILVGTTPSVGYFGTTLYPDLTAAVLVTAALFAIDGAVRRRLLGRSDRSGAPALLALGLFMKETLLPTGAVVVLLTLLRGLRSRRWTGALRLALAVSAPLGLYLVFRTAAQRLLQRGQPFRTIHTLDLSALTNPAAYAILLRALAEQFGPLLLLAGLGLALSRQHRRSALLALVAVGQLQLFAIDAVDETPWGRLPVFWGHARFLLTLLPTLVCLSVEALSWLGRRPPLAAVALAAAVAWNAWARPVAFDGSRPPFWGDFVEETSGERYPYDALYAWLARSGERRPLTIVGRDYSYADDFYVKKHGLELRVDAPSAPMPRSSLVVAGGPDRARLLQAHVARLERAKDAAGPVVLHVSAWLDPDELPREVGGRREVQRFTLGRHALVLYDAR